MTKYESMMVGNKKVSDERSLQGAKMPKRNSSEKAQSAPYDASHGLYLKKGGSVKKKEVEKEIKLHKELKKMHKMAGGGYKKGGHKKMAMGGAAKVRKGMMTPKGKPKV